MAFTRRDFLAHAAAGVVLAGCATTPTPAVSVRRPNILFVYTDDQAAWGVHSIGDVQAHTPVLDAFFAESVVLENALVTTPVCSPSRAGLLTSRYGTEVGITDWISPRPGPNRRDESELGLDPTHPTWVRQLRDAGYRTGLVGKWHLGTQDRFQPVYFGYDHFFGFREGGAKVVDPELEENGVARTYAGLTTDILTDAALDFLASAADDEPFLLSLHYRAPHAPWLPVREEDEAPFQGIDIAPPEPDFPDLDTERVKQSLREYFQSIHGIDRNLGRILAYLDARGLRDNTVVVFTSDHGYNIGHHGIIHKGNASWITNAARELPPGDPRRLRSNMFDHSLRVPAAVRWPAALAPARVTHTVTNLDWYPTVLAMAGLLPAGPVHGRDFLPLLRGEPIPWDNDVYGEYSQHHYRECDLRMFRTPAWKLVRDYRNPGLDELYHLATDPGETQNRIDDPAAADALIALDARLNETMHRIGSRPG